jgi:hypothetical protein
LRNMAKLLLSSGDTMPALWWRGCLVLLHLRRKFKDLGDELANRP